MNRLALTLLLAATSSGALAFGPAPAPPAAPPADPPPDPGADRVIDSNAGAGGAASLLALPLAAHAQSSRPESRQPSSLAPRSPEPSGSGSWVSAGRDQSRVSAISTSAQLSPPPLSFPSITISHLPDGTPIEFMTRTSPVADGTTAFALAWINNAESLVAIDLASMTVAWVAPLPFLEADSWSSPAIDPQHRSVLVAMGDEVIAFNARTGRVRWSTTLLGPVVNASPIVTDDLGPRDRAFVTDYGYFSDAGRLYCINTDPYHVSDNPYLPGDTVWSVVIDSVSSGNSPAYQNNTVYLATPGDGFGGGGSVRAYPASSITPPPPIWVFNNTIDAGFFGGVCVRDGSVYTASYGFGGVQLNSNLVRLDALTGTLVWSAPSNRTASTPVPLADGRVVLAGGILPDPVFGDSGSRPSVAVYDPAGTLTLETALDTWTDSNANTVIDPGEALLVGGWTHQPLVIESASGHAQLVCGVANPAVSVPNGEAGLTRLDLGWTPGSTFPLVLQATPLAGGSPAVAAGRLLSLGQGGLTVWLNHADRQTIRSTP